MTLYLSLIVLLVQSLTGLMSEEPNSLCNPNALIDSAFVDKYSDLGADVITLFVGPMVHQLTATSGTGFRLKRSLPLSQWTSADIQSPIHNVYYDLNYISVLTLVLETNDKKWKLDVNNKTQELVDSHSRHGDDPNKHLYVSEPKVTANGTVCVTYEIWLFTTGYIIDKKTVPTVLNTKRAQKIGVKLKNDGKSEQYINETINYLNGLSAAFLYQQDIYMIAGRKICPMNSDTFEWQGQCLKQTVAQWIGCPPEESEKSTKSGSKTWLIVVIILVVLAILVGVIVAFLLIYWRKSGKSHETKPSSVAKPSSAARPTTPKSEQPEVANPSDSDVTPMGESVETVRSLNF